MSGLKHEALVKIGAELDEAVVNADRWPSLLDEVASACGAEGAGLLRVEKVVTSSVWTPGIAELSARYYGEGWNKADHRQKGIPLMQRRGVCVDQDFTTPEEMETLPYYQELLAARGLRWFAGVGFQAGNRFLCVTIHRTPVQGLFDLHEQKSLALLTPALRRAALLTAATDGARLAGMTEALDFVDRPALILGDGGYALRLNASFAALLDQDIRILGQRLVLNDQEAARRLDQLSHPQAQPAVAPVIVRRREASPLVLYAVPLSGPTRCAFSGGTLLLLACNPEARTQIAPDVLKAAFRLTPREAALAVVLAEGISAVEAAERLGIAHETARVHMKSVFDKLGVRRQGELVRLLAALAGPVTRQSRP